VDREALEAGWARTRWLLALAHDALLEATDAVDCAGYHEYLEANELDLALEVLAGHASDQAVPAAVWEALAQAAQSMGLVDDAERYRQQSV
jgi:hypothetical protein